MQNVNILEGFGVSIIASNRILYFIIKYTKENGVVLI